MDLDSVDRGARRRRGPYRALTALPTNDRLVAVAIYRSEHAPCWRGLVSPLAATPECSGPGSCQPAARGCHAGPVTEHHVVAAIRGALAAAGDPERAVAQQAYMKSEMPFRGIGSQELTALLRPILADPGIPDLPSRRVGHRGPGPLGRCHPPGGAVCRDRAHGAPRLSRVAGPGRRAALRAPRADRCLVGPRRPGRLEPDRTHPARAPRGLDAAGQGLGDRRRPLGAAGQRSSASWPSGPTPTRRCCARASSPTWPTARSGSERRSGGPCGSTPAPTRSGSATRCPPTATASRDSPRREALKHL